MVWSTLAGSGDYYALFSVGDITSAQCQLIRIPESEILGFGIRASARRIQNPANDENRGTQCLFSVSKNIALNFLLLEDGEKLLDDRSIHVQFSRLILVNSIRFSEV